jgi:hypothetical protein
MVERCNVGEIKKGILSHSVPVSALSELTKRDLLRVFLGYDEKIACGRGRNERYATLLVAAIYNEDYRVVESLVRIARERLEPPEQYPLLWYRGQGFMKHPGMSDDPEYIAKRSRVNERLGGMLFGWAHKIREIGPELDLLQRGGRTRTYNIPEGI